MTDAAAAAAELQRRLLLALPGDQRMSLAAGMFDTARSFVLASLPDGLSEEEVRVSLCRRIYGDEVGRQVAGALRERADGDDTFL